MYKVKNLGNDCVYKINGNANLGTIICVEKIYTLKGNKTIYKIKPKENQKKAFKLESDKVFFGDNASKLTGNTMGTKLGMFD